MFTKTLQKSLDEIGKITRISKLIPQSEKKALAPGTVKYVGKKRDEPITLHVLDYDESNFVERDVASVKECLPFKDSPTVTWLNVSGVYDAKLIEEIGQLFNIHALVLEDIANTTQRSKMEEYEDYLYVVIKTVSIDARTRDASIEQVSLVVGKDFVISFQERHMDVLEPLRERIRNGKGKVRHLGSDYLMYVIIDTIIDHYYSILEQLGEHMEELEKTLLSNPSQKTLNSIYQLKQEIVFIRKSIWPAREMVSSLMRIEHKLISQSIHVYLRDVYDHVIQVVDTVETFRDIASGMLELYLSTISNKMNEVMKVLTIFSAIFIPLTFIVGIYGMNFDNMPELHFKNGYYGVLGIMLTLFISMLFYFRKKDWL